MRRQLLFLVILLAATGADALTPAEQGKATGKAAADVESDSAERAGKKSPPPAASFTPSEKIEADSAVSFPVDI